MTGREIEDKRAQWLGYSDAGHYLTKAADTLQKRQRAPRWVWSHYRAIFMGQMPKGRR